MNFVSFKLINKGNLTLIKILNSRFTKYDKGNFIPYKESYLRQEYS